MEVVLPARTARRRPPFSPIQYLAPYLLFIVASAGVQRVSVDHRPALFWAFAAAGALGVLSTIVRLRRMREAHRNRPLPGWTLFLGALLALYGLFVCYCVVDGIAS
jgi:drug/metabolite transporter (DMT)-like permease